MSKFDLRKGGSSARSRLAGQFPLGTRLPDARARASVTRGRARARYAGEPRGCAGVNAPACRHARGRARRAHERRGTARGGHARGPSSRRRFLRLTSAALRAIVGASRRGRPRTGRRGRHLRRPHRARESGHAGDAPERRNI